MNDRLDAIKELMSQFSGPDRYQEVLKLMLEELRYLRDKNAELSNAAAEFARLVRL